MPRHLHYVEPYAGGLAVLLARDPTDRRLWKADGPAHLRGASEVVNDVHGPLTTFWRVLEDPALFADFSHRVQGIPFCEDRWLRAQAHSYGADPVADAVEFFVHNRMSLAGRMDGFAPLSRTRTRGGRNEQANAWLNAVEGLPAVHARLKGVVILNRDALEVIRQQDGPDTLFYLDPPYPHGTRESTDVYAHEMTEAQHRELLDLLGQVQGKVMLSGYPNVMYDGALSGWTQHTFDLPNHASGARTKDRETEVLWCNV
jgi:DNA adenine methylase